MDDDAIASLAAEATSEFWRAAPEMAATLGEPGRELAQRDLRYHFQFLREAVRFRQPALFLDHVDWARALQNRMHLPASVLPESLRCMRRAMERNHAGESGEAARACIDLALERLAGQNGNGDGLLDAASPWYELTRGYLDALLAGRRRDACESILQAVERGAGLKNIYLDVLQPCMYEVGRLWQTNAISVAQEHYCTATTQLVMSQFYPRIFATPRAGKRIVAACVGGDLHEIGLRMIADCFELEGWDTVFLGASTPTESVAQMVRESKADLLAISATLTLHLPGLMDLIACIRGDACTAGVPILVGGAPFNRTPGLWISVGADGFARDAREALLVAGQLLGGGAKRQ